MAWFRAATGVARHALRRTLIARATAATRSRGFDISALRRRASAPAPPAVPLTDSFLDGTSSVYLEELQRAWEADPSFVDESWDNFFRNFLGPAAPSAGLSGQTIQESMQLLLLVRAYQVNGHMKARLDPLGLDDRAVPEDLDLSNYGFTEADLDREFFLGVWMMSGFLSENRPVLTLREILSKLEQAYCGPIGFEYMDNCNWLREKIVMLDRLIWSTQFENFLATKWATAKRFGLEGVETLIPGMKEMFNRSADLSLENIVIGMPHRGRISVLGNVVPQISIEFPSGTRPVEGEDGLYTGTANVKYHLGTSYDLPARGGKRIQLSSVANPSHLEAGDPVVVGKTRAKQFYSNDADRTKYIGILINGGDSFAGQGIICETLHASAFPNYTTRGTIHIGGNNQAAFTTDPGACKFSQYNTQAAPSEGLGRVLTFGISSQKTLKSKRMLPFCTFKRAFSSMRREAPIIHQLMCYDDYEINNLRWRYLADCIIKGGGILKPMSPGGLMRAQDITKCGGYELGSLAVHFLRQGAGLATINLMRGRNVSKLMKIENLLWSPERSCLMFKEYDLVEDEGTLNPYRALYDVFEKAVELSTGYNLSNLPYPLPKDVAHFLHYLLTASITDKRLITNHSVTRFPVERIQKKMALNNLLRRRLPFHYGQAGSFRAFAVFHELGRIFPLELLKDEGLQPAIDYWARKATELRGDFSIFPGALSPVVGPLNEHGVVVFGTYRYVALGRILVALMRDPFEHPNGPGSDLGEPFCSEMYDHIDIENLLNAFVPAYLHTAEEMCLVVGLLNLLETDQKNKPPYECWTDTSWEEGPFPDLREGLSASF